MQFPVGLLGPIRDWGQRHTKKTSYYWKKHVSFMRTEWLLLLPFAMLGLWPARIPLRPNDENHTMVSLGFPDSHHDSLLGRSECCTHMKQNGNKPKVQCACMEKWDSGICMDIFFFVQGHLQGPVSPGISSKFIFFEALVKVRTRLLGNKLPLYFPPILPVSTL